MAEEDTSTGTENTQTESTLYPYRIDGKPIYIDSFNNVHGTVSGNNYSLQNLMENLYGLSNSIIISSSNPGTPPAGKGFWLDTSVSSNTNTSGTTS